MHKAENIANIEPLDQVLHAFTHGVGATGDYITFINQLLPGHVSRFTEVGAELRQGPGFNGFNSAIARCIGKTGGNVQAAVKEIADVVLVRKKPRRN